MNAEYPARYRDEYSDEETTIRNDGKTLRMRLRGVAFSGTHFDNFEPEEGTDASALASFRLDFYNELYGCVIECEMPLPMMANGEMSEAALHVRVATGVPDERGGLDRDEIHLTLHFAGNDYRGSGRSGWFEDELLEIQKALPEGVYMQACINCAFSDYSPSGHQVFGDMACFRDNKAEYLQVKSKWDIFRIWGTSTEFVQETYLCPEFQQRTPGTGYRGKKCGEIDPCSEVTWRDPRSGNMRSLST